MYADQIEIALLALQARSYYLTGAMEAAQRVSAQALAQAQAVKLLTGEGLDGQVAAAQAVLDWSAQWEKAPLVVEPARVEFIAGGEPSMTITVRTRAAVPLQAVSADDQVAGGLVKAALRRDEYFVEQVLLVQIAPAAMEPGFATTLTVSSAQLPNVAVQVPVVVVAPPPPPTGDQPAAEKPAAQPPAAQPPTVQQPLAG